MNALHFNFREWFSVWISIGVIFIGKLENGFFLALKLSIGRKYNMDEGESRIKQEDCSEDNLGSGILTLTNKRMAFDKTRARMMDFTKQFGDTIVEVKLKDIIKTWKEGRLMKKVCVTANTKDGEKTFKFGVFNTKDWLENIETAIQEYKNQ